MQARAWEEAEWTSSVITEVDEPAWDRVMRTHPGSRCIIPKWDELAGWTRYRLGLFHGAELCGGLIMAVRRIPGLPFSLGRITCIMLGPFAHSEMLERLLHEVERFSMKRLIIETELRLRIPVTEEIEGFSYHGDVLRVLEKWGYLKLNKTDSTYLVRIDQSDEGILQSFESKTRNMVRKAQKSGAVIATSHDSSLIQQFYQSYLQMGARKRAPIPPKDLVEGLKPLIDQGYALLFTESYNDVISNMVVVDALGVPCYLLGTRTEANVKGEVQGAAQVLHYEIMKYFRDRGKKYYDLGGCEGPTPVEGHANFGVWRFKYRFQGAYVQFLPYFRKTRGPTRRVLDVVHRLRGDHV